MGKREEKIIYILFRIPQQEFTSKQNEKFKENDKTNQKQMNRHSTKLN